MVKRGPRLHHPIDQIDQQKYENLHPEYPEISSFVKVVCLYIVFFICLFVLSFQVTGIRFTPKYLETQSYGLQVKEDMVPRWGGKKFLFLLYFRFISHIEIHIERTWTTLFHWTAPHIANAKFTLMQLTILRNKGAYNMQVNIVSIGPLTMASDRGTLDMGSLGGAQMESN